MTKIALPKGRQGLLLVGVALAIVAFIYLQHRSKAAAGLLVPQSMPDVAAWPGSPYYPGQTGGGGSVGVDLSPSGTGATGPISGYVPAGGGGTSLPYTPPKAIGSGVPPIVIGTGGGTNIGGAKR